MRHNKIDAAQDIKALSEIAYNYYSKLDGYKVWKIGKNYYTEDANGFYPAWNGLKGVVEELEYVATMHCSYCEQRIA